MSGAIDLFAGSNSLSGTNLLKVNHSPLDQLDEGIEDVIGKQANGAAGQVTGLLGALVSGILGLGEDVFGTLTDVIQYFGNLETFLGELNPLDPNFNPLAAAEQFIQTVLNPAGIGSLITGIVPSAITGLAEFVIEAVGDTISTVESGIQSLIDAIFGGLTSTNGIGIGIEFIQPALQQVALDIQSIGKAAEQAVETVFNFGGILHTLVEGLESNPVYTSAEHFIQSIEGVVGQVWTNIINALSPANPGTQQNSAAITAILAHLSASTVAGINYQFSVQVPLTNNYLTTSNPSWTAVTGYALLQPKDNDFVLTPGTTMGVFTGNPNNATTGDHGVVTDRSHVQCTIKSVEIGAGEIFMHGHGVPSLGQNVSLRYEVDLFSQSLYIFTYTGAQSGGQTRTATNVALKANDTIAMEYDPGTNAYTMYVNGTEVGDPWVDALGAVTHGAGYREAGMKVNLGNLFFAPGPAFGSFIAYDF